jgi:hypothetical protein
MPTFVHEIAGFVNVIIAEEIQGNPSLFLGKIWLGLGLVWPSFDQFGIGLEGPITYMLDKINLCHSSPRGVGASAR